MKIFPGVAILWGLVFIASSVFAQDAPVLPPGLEDTAAPEKIEGGSGPALPEGLGEGSGSDTPSLPLGLEEAAPPLEKAKEAMTLPPGLSGFFESRAGVRTQNDAHQKEATMGEIRLQIQVEQSFRKMTFNLTADFLYDPVLDRHNIDLEKGDGFVDLREANVLLRPGNAIDLKVGRQILTWGTGDLIFINDLFPKDWNAFFIGRDTEYLKAPSDVFKASFFSRVVNIDVVYTPRFDPDRFIDGRRISYFNIQSGVRAGRNAIVRADTPDEWFDDDEIAWRVYKNVSGLELAVYGYDGYWKSPGGVDPVRTQATFPALSVYGASARGTLWRGIGNLEAGYYDSEDDPEGNNPRIRNGELRFLAGYEQEVFTNLTAGLQYYLEHMMDHADYVRMLPAGAPRADENRHVVTLRLTQLLMNQDLTLSLFTFYSPSDEDAYLRLNAHYKIDDFWSVEFGGNVFLGKDAHTFFGQFEKNSNVYAGVRYGF